MKLIVLSTATQKLTKQYRLIKLSWGQGIALDIFLCGPAYH